MEYKELDEKQGWDFLSKVWTVFIFKDEDVFVNPFSNRGLRFRCLFIDKKIYLYLTIEEIEKITDLNPTPEQVYFYGAYNQINVCQMRTLCNVRQVQITKEFNRIFRLITYRLLGDKVVSDNFLKNSISPNGEEKIKASQSLCEPGRLYCFEPLSYAYNIYERG